MVKNPPAMLESGIPSVSWDKTLEKGMATHSSILARRMPRTEEPAEMQFMGRKESDTTKPLLLHFKVKRLKRKERTW